MKRTRVTTRIGTSGTRRGPGYSPDVGFATPLRLQQALARLEAAKDALAEAEKQKLEALQQVERLTEENTRLRHLAAKREEEVAKVRHFAYHDELTGLPNRALLLDRLNQALSRAKRQRSRLGLLLLDLDGFKAINDGMGHAAGDRLLQQVAVRLESCIRGSDTACRYGGDEFILLLPDIQSEKRAVGVAKKVHVHFARPFEIGGAAVTVTASIGVALSTKGISAQDLIQQADGAMYIAKTVVASSTALGRVVVA